MLVDLAAIIAIYAISLESLLFALSYTIYLFLAFGLVVYVFCRKCKARHNCSHYFLGQFTMLMPPSKESAYKKSDYIIVLALLLPVFVLPTYWIIQLNILSYVYFGLLLVAGIQVNRFVCPDCKNDACAMCGKNVCSQNNE